MLYISAVWMKAGSWVEDTDPINFLNRGNGSACEHFSLDMTKSTLFLSIGIDKSFYVFWVSALNALLASYEVCSGPLQLESCPYPQENLKWLGRWGEKEALGLLVG